MNKKEKFASAMKKLRENGIENYVNLRENTNLYNAYGEEVAAYCKVVLSTVQGSNKMYSLSKYIDKQDIEQVVLTHLCTNANVVDRLLELADKDDTQLLSYSYVIILNKLTDIERKVYREEQKRDRNAEMEQMKSPYRFEQEVENKLIIKELLMNLAIEVTAKELFSFFTTYIGLKLKDIQDALECGEQFIEDVLKEINSQYDTMFIFSPTDKEEILRLNVKSISKGKQKCISVLNQIAKEKSLQSERKLT